MSAGQVRSGWGSSLMWFGALIVVLGAFTALYALALLVQEAWLGAAITTAAGLLVIAGGVVLFLLARRAVAWVDARGVSWSTMLGARSFVPWEQVRQVVVPGTHEKGNAVLLWLWDGSVVPVASLRKTQSVGSTRPHPWYLRAGAAVADAHQQWLVHHGRL